jgi:hypothetical protein
MDEQKSVCACGSSDPVQPVGCKGFGYHQFENRDEWDDHAYWSHRIMSIRPFRMKRGKTIVGSGVVLPSGRVAFEWNGAFDSVAFYRDFETFEHIHVDGHTGTLIIWLAPENTGKPRKHNDHPFGPRAMEEIARITSPTTQEADHASAITEEK